MRLHALVFSLVVLHARAASIPEKSDIDFERTLQQAVKEVLTKEGVAPDNISSEQELIDQANSVKDIENNLRNRVPVADIPVKVVVEDVQPALKTNTDKDNKENNEVVPESEEIKRVEIDLKDTGLPQRQQHDTQSPEEIKPDSEAILKQDVANFKNLINEGAEQLKEGVQNQMVQMQNNLHQLQESFQNQVNKLNQTLQKILKPEGSNPAVQAKANVVESSLSTLQNNIKAGIKSLADRIDTFRGEKQSNGCAAETGSTSQESQNPFQSYFQQLSQQVQQGFQNMSTSFQSYVNQTQNNANSNSTGGGFFQGFGQGPQTVINQQGSNNPLAQADESATSRPSFWQNIQNIFQGGSSQQVQSDTPVNQPDTPNRPIVQAIQNNPFVQGVVSVFQPNRPAANQPAASQPATQKPEAPQTNQESSNAVPSETKPEPEAQKQKPETATFSQSGPIKQIFIDKNPIVQGIAGAVQRIQDSVKPERPRDAIGAVDEEVPDAKGHGHGGSGTNNNAATEHLSGSSSGVVLKSEPEVEKQEETLEKQETPEKQEISEMQKSSEIQETSEIQKSSEMQEPLEKQETPAKPAEEIIEKKEPEVSEKTE